MRPRSPTTGGTTPLARRLPGGTALRRSQPSSGTGSSTDRAEDAASAIEGDDSGGRPRGEILAALPQSQAQAVSGSGFGTISSARNVSAGHGGGLSRRHPRG